MPVEFYDEIAVLESGLRCRRAGIDSADDRRRLAEGGDIVRKHRQKRGYSQSQCKVGARTGERNQNPLVAGLGAKFSGMAGQGFGVRLACHSDVASERYEADPIVCTSSGKAEESHAETEAEDLDLDVEEFRNQEVARFVEKHHGGEY